MSDDNFVNVEFLMWDGSFLPGTVGRGFVAPIEWRPVDASRLARVAIYKYFGSEKDSVDSVKDVRLCVGNWRISIGRGMDEQ
jgi:hypothetical protein